MACTVFFSYAHASTCPTQAKEEEERRAAEFASLKASLAAGDKLEPAAAEQLVRYLLEEADGSAAKVGLGCGSGVGVQGQM